MKNFVNCFDDVRSGLTADDTEMGNVIWIFYLILTACMMRCPTLIKYGKVSNPVISDISLPCALSYCSFQNVFALIFAHIQRQNTG